MKPDKAQENKKAKKVFTRKEVLKSLELLAKNIFKKVKEKRTELTEKGDSIIGSGGDEDRANDYYSRAHGVADALDVIRKAIKDGPDKQPEGVKK